MELSVTINVPQFRDALSQFIRYTRMEIPKALRYQGRLLADRLIRGPKGSGGGRGTATPPATRAQGRAAVQRDIYKTMIGLKTDDDSYNPSRPGTLIHNADLRLAVEKAAEKGDLEAVKKILTQAGWDSPDVEHFNPTFHEDERNSRGRVAGKGRRPKIILEADELYAYVKKKQDNVGRAKGGWSTALLALGGSTSAWISRWSNLGDIKDNASDPVNSYILMTNESEWASGGDEDRIVANALESRAQAMLSSIAIAQQKAMAAAFQKSI